LHSQGKFHRKYEKLCIIVGRNIPANTHKDFDQMWIKSTVMITCLIHTSIENWFVWTYILYFVHCIPQWQRDAKIVGSDVARVHYDDKKYSINHDNQKWTLPEMIRVIKESCNHITGTNNLSMLAAKLVETLSNEDNKQQK